MEISQTLAVEAVIGEPVSGPHISLLHGKMQGISAEQAPKAGMRRRLPNHIKRLKRKFPAQENRELA